MIETIRWQADERLYFLGRNGNGRSTGIEIYDNDGVVFLQPFASKDALGRCLIAVPVSALPGITSTLARIGRGKENGIARSDRVCPDPEKQRHPVKPFRVVWEIDLDAQSPRHAAEIALSIMRDPDSIATVFRVEDSLTTSPLRLTKTITIDLSKKRSDGRRGNAASPK